MKYNNIELYQFTSPRRFWSGEPHTDSIRFVDFISDKDADEIYEPTVLFDEVLSPEEYNRTINANSSEVETEPVRVVVIISNEDCK